MVSRRYFLTLYFFYFMSDHFPDPFYHETDPRIRIRIKIKRIRITGCTDCENNLSLISSRANVILNCQVHSMLTNSTVFIQVKATIDQFNFIWRCYEWWSMQWMGSGTWTSSWSATMIHLLTPGSILIAWSGFDLYWTRILYKLWKTPYPDPTLHNCV